MARRFRDISRHLPLHKYCERKADIAITIDRVRFDYKPVSRDTVQHPGGGRLLMDRGV